nr:NAD(P)/FAD-dependent oxidoreductase [Pseudomaricurvus alkylphenolicus]
MVVGGGHNGLVAACYLARSGHSVQVLEKRQVAGGASISQPLVSVAPEYTLSPGAIDAVFIRQTSIIEELRLARFGFSLIDVDPGYGWVNEDGDSLMLFQSVKQTAEDIKYYSKKDASQYLELAEVFQLILEIQSDFMSRPLSQSGWCDLVRAAWKLVADKSLRRTLGRLLSVSAYEAIAETFESEPLRGLYAYWCAIACPPDAENSGVFLASFSQIHQLGCSRPRGGMSSLINALSNCLMELGGEIRTSASVKNIVVENSQARGVVLNSGEVINARLGVIGACAPQITLGQLLQDNDRPQNVREQLPFIPANASNMGPFKIDMAIDGPLLFERASQKRGQRDGVDINGASLMTGTLDEHVDHTSQVRLGRLGKKPPIWMTVLSHNDKTLAPEGKSTAYLYTSIPVKTDMSEEELSHRCSNFLVESSKQYLVGLGAELGRNTLTPLAFNDEFSLPNGCIYHVDMLPTRLGPLRPARGLGGGSTEIKSLYLGGAGSHPGGGVYGLPGKFAAQEALISKG